MFRNDRGVMVPHCTDCVHYPHCPEDAVADEIPDDTGVALFACFFGPCEKKLHPKGRGK